MAPHSFLFHPEPDELHDYLDAIKKVESQNQFSSRVAVDLQLHGGHWAGEFSASTSRLLMEFITAVTMELPAEKMEDPWATSTEQEEKDGEQELVAEAPVWTEEEDGDPQIDGEVEAQEAKDDAAYEEHEKAAGRTPPKKLKRPVTVGKTSNPAITVEEG